MRDDGLRLRTWQSGAGSGGVPVVLVHGGPGLPDYLAPVAAMLDGPVHRYDQRGTGGSGWTGEHTIARHVRDLELLLDGWGYRQVVLLGHSFGTDLVSYFLLAHPERVAGVIYVAGPFLWSWRGGDVLRRTAAQQARLDQLGGAAARTEAEETELLTLAWFTDHADRGRAWEWAHDAARSLRPVNWAMNAQLNADKKAYPLESRVDRLRELLPAGSAIIGGAGDPRPAGNLRRLAALLGCAVVIVPGAGHHPWLERPGEFRSAVRHLATGFRAVHTRVPASGRPAWADHEQGSAGMDGIDMDLDGSRRPVAGTTAPAARPPDPARAHVSRRPDVLPDDG